jgi:hypothetical protein
MTPEAQYAVNQMRKSLRRAEQADWEAARVRKEITEKTAHEFREGSGRPPLGNTIKDVADARVGSNPNFKLAVSNNEWQMKKSVMYGINALVELMIDDTDEPSS